MKRFAVGFAAMWMIALLFNAWGSLSWPNPFIWTPFERQFALYFSVCAGVVSFALGKKP